MAGMSLAQLRDRIADNAFQAYLGVDIESAEFGAAVLILPERPELNHINGTIHGGAIAALIDMAVAAAIATTDEELAFATLHIAVDFLKTAKGRLTARAHLVKDSRVIVADCSVEDSEGAVVASGRSTFLRFR